MGGRREEDAAARELRRFDASLEVAVQQSLRRVKEAADYVVKQAVQKEVPQLVGKYVESSEECKALKHHTLEQVQREMVARCASTLKQLAQETALREALATAAEAKATAAVDRLQRWVYGVGLCTVLALGLACQALRSARK